jgi:hypothetical protein
MLHRALLRGCGAACSLALVIGARSAQAQVEAPRDYEEGPPSSPPSEPSPVRSAAVGLGSAMVIDASAFAYGKREIAEPRESGLPRVTSVAPSYDPLTRSASLGMGGRF